MLVLHSSSALVCNFFDYWRHQDTEVLASTLGVSTNMKLSFERPFPVRQGGIPAHLDVILEGETVDDKPLAIEAKFLEPLLPPKQLKKFYCNQDLWDQWDMERCQQFTNSILNESVTFDMLDVAQLVAHTVGLTRRYGRDGYSLLYLWYDFGGEEAARLREEIDCFTTAIGGEINFSTLTYQELFSALSRNSIQHTAYFQYLGERYFENA